MENKVEFKCGGENLEQIPEEVICRTGITFPSAHKDKNSMTLLATELKKAKGDLIVRVPFCVTVEAEAFGSQINLGDDRIGPRVQQYRYNTLEELGEIREIDLGSGRIKEVLDCVEQLRNNGEVVTLSAEGPLTIISALIDPMLFFKGIRQNREIVDKFMRVIEDSVVKYILAGIAKGAQIISYADPVGSMDIVGPKVYKEISGKSSYNILKRIEDHLGNSLVHLCGKTSTALDKLEYCTTMEIKTEAGVTYGQALIDLLGNQRGVKFIGHRCIKTSPAKLGKPVVYRIELN